MRILFSGLTGNAGLAALKVLQSGTVPDVEITGGISRHDYNGKNAIIREEGGSQLRADFTGIKWYQYGDLNNVLRERPQRLDYDMILAFDHADVVSEVIAAAVRMRVPLICGTSGLSDRQQAMLNDACRRIPVFRGGNFRIEAEQFADRVAEMSQRQSMPDLVETLYEGHAVPSETGKMLQQRILQASGQLIDIDSRRWYPTDSLFCEWDFPGTGLHYEATGFEDVMTDVFKIAKVMSEKVADGVIYDLSSIWLELGQL